MRADPFFRNTPRKHLEMAGEAIAFPILYYDSRMLSITFNVKTSRLKKLLPHPNLKPIEILPGTGMFTIAALEYRDTSIEPYNEIAICVPVIFPPKLIFPALPVISMLQKCSYTVYIHHLPVTTEKARQVGVHFYNYPKFLAGISFKDRDDTLEVALREDDELILKIYVGKLPHRQSVQMEFHTYSIRENVVMYTLIEGMAPRYRMKMFGNGASLELGSHPISREIMRLGLGKTALAVQYIDGMMTKLHCPNQYRDVNTLAAVMA